MHCLVTFLFTETDIGWWNFFIYDIFHNTNLFDTMQHWKTIELRSVVLGGIRKPNTKSCFCLFCWYHLLKWAIEEKSKQKRKQRKENGFKNYCTTIRLNKKILECSVSWRSHIDLFRVTSCDSGEMLWISGRGWSLVCGELELVGLDGHGEASPVSIRGTSSNRFHKG